MIVPEVVSFLMTPGVKIEYIILRLLIEKWSMFLVFLIEEFHSMESSESGPLQLSHEQKYLR